MSNPDVSTQDVSTPDASAIDASTPDASAIDVSVIDVTSSNTSTLEDEARIIALHQQLCSTKSDLEHQQFWQSLSLADQIKMLPSSRAKFQARSSYQPPQCAYGFYRYHNQ